MMRDGGQKNRLLDHIRIIDMADEKASFSSKLLADLGARVVKVERPGGDPSRWIGPFWGDSPHPERSLFFHHNNTNKLSVTLDLEHPMGKDIFLRLVERTDVIVESFPVGYLKEIELDFENLISRNPRLILASVTGFGQSGPRSEYKSCDLVASAFGGQMYISGSVSTPPLKPAGEQSYYTASLFAAIGVLLALRKRACSGKGEHIDISLQESLVSTLDHVMVRYFYENVAAQRQGGLYWNNAFCTLPCKDGHILLTPFQRWETLVEWMDTEGMAEDLKDEKYCSEQDRVQHMGHILEVIQRWTEAHTVDELFKLGQLMHFPWAPVHSPKEVLDSPQLKERGFFFDTEHPEMDVSLKYLGMPYKFICASLDRWRRPPFIGEDNIPIYQGELGLSREELENLSSMKVI